MKTEEKKLMAISLTLLAFWSTEGVLHKFDTSSTTLAAVALMFLPGVTRRNRLLPSNQMLDCLLITALVVRID